MIIMYVDKHGNAMKMESPDDKEIRIPVLCKEYNNLTHSMVITIDPGMHEYRQMMKVERKQKDGFTFTWLSMVLKGDPRDQFNWHLEGVEKLYGEGADMVGAQWLTRRESWYKQHCSFWGLTSTQYMSNLGDSFYLSDTVVTDLKNCTLHLFGYCKICTANLSNVLLYIHGSYGEI